MIKVVMFDFDDTLCLTEEACFNLENKVVLDMGFPPMSHETHKKTWGKNLKDVIVERVPGIDPEEFVRRQEALFAIYMNEGSFEKINDENLSILEELKKKGLRLGVLTNRSLAEARHLLHEDHPLSKHLEAFYYKDILDYHKPDPRAFDQALKFFRVRPEEVVYVGDSVGDGVAAKQAGMHFIAVMESGIRTKEDFKDVPVDYFAPKFTDILNYISLG